MPLLRQKSMKVCFKDLNWLERHSTRIHQLAQKEEPSLRKTSKQGKLKRSSIPLMF